jgi:hypothetical protein
MRNEKMRGDEGTMGRWNDRMMEREGDGKKKPPEPMNVSLKQLEPSRLGPCCSHVISIRGEEVEHE